MKPSPKPHAAKPAAADRQRADSPSPARSAPSIRQRSRSRTESPYAETLLERFASTSRFQTFNAAIGTAGLASLLGGTGPITIFAPTDHAFDKLSTTHRASLLADPARLGDLIRRHVVAGRVKAPRVGAPRSVTPEFGDDLELTASERGFHVDEARIVKTNIRATNGVIHAIDTVLDPSGT